MTPLTEPHSTVDPNQRAAPTLVFIIGPPAVGKMTVGAALAERSGFRLFHNHQTIDLVTRFFDWGTPSFQRLVAEFRRRIFEEVSASELPGMIFTYVWAFDDPRDAETVESYAALFRSRGGRVLFVELEATQDERLRRNATPLRLSEKPFKRDLDKSRRQLLEVDAKYRLNSQHEFDGRSDYLRINNTDVTPDVVADRVIAHFRLTRANSP